MIINLLVVDDDEVIINVIKDTFARDRGYRVAGTKLGRQALAAASRGEADLLVLDWNLPDVSGYEVCRILRRDPKTAEMPVLMLTGEGRVNKKVDALERGADDYLVKPFNLDELKARIKAILRRRTPWLVQSVPLQFGDLRLDPAALKAFVKDVDIGLTPMEFNITYVLAVNAGSIVSRRFIELRVLEKEEFSRALDVHLTRIRGKLGPAHARRIETSKKLGYLFSGD